MGFSTDVTADVKRVLGVLQVFDKYEIAIRTRVACVPVQGYN